MSNTPAPVLPAHGGSFFRTTLSRTEFSRGAGVGGETVPLDPRRTSCPLFPPQGKAAQLCSPVTILQHCGWSPGAFTPSRPLACRGDQKVRAECPWGLGKCLSAAPLLQTRLRAHMCPVQLVPWLVP